MGFEQTTSELVARENETRIFNELKTDFFVGPNGKILPKAFEQWIGANRREALLKKAKNPKVKNVVNQLYRPNSFGSNGNTHMQKGKEMLRYIEKKSSDTTKLICK